MNVRISLNYRGRVQGVGFRWRVSQIAKSFPCTGYVKNLPDGSVELLIEGEKYEGQRMVQTVNLEMKGFWYDKTMDEREDDSHFVDFGIEH
jgi:acylphosphatase